MGDMERPYISLVSLGELDRPAAEEHYDAVHLMVIDVMRRVTGELSYAVDQAVRRALRESEFSTVQQAAKEVMNKAYLTSLFGELRLMGRAEVAEFLGLHSPHRLSQMRKAVTLNFPKPIAELKMGPVWLTKDIERWAPTWSRKSGRSLKEN